LNSLLTFAAAVCQLVIMSVLEHCTRH